MGGARGRNGQFNRADGVAATGTGSLYVADAGNDRIQLLDSAGAFVLKWGDSGTGNGQFDEPIDVAVGGDGSVYVAEQNAARIQQFSSTGTFIDKWGTPGGGIGEFGTVNALATYTDGGTTRWSTSRTRATTASRSSTPTAAPGQWGTAGSAAGEFSEINGITTDSAGNVWTLEGQNRRVQKFTASGGPILEFEVSPPAVCGTAGIDVDASFFYVACGTARSSSATAPPPERSSTRLAAASTCWGSACTPRGGSTWAAGKECTASARALRAAGAVSPIIFGGAEGVTINDGASTRTMPRSS